MKFVSQALLLTSLVTWSTSQLRWDLDGAEAMLPMILSEELYALSDTICAVRCITRRCSSFTFEGELCRIYNKGLGSADTTVKLFHLAHSPVNMAVLKPTQASPQFGESVKENGNDGNMNTVYHSNRGEAYAWFNVDLGLVYPILEIRIYPNYMFSPHYVRFHGIELKAGNEPAVSGEASSYTRIAYYVGPYRNITCCSFNATFNPPVMARYIHVRRATPAPYYDDFLIFREIEIYV